MTRVLILFLLFSCCCQAQKDSIVARTQYNGGKTKSIAVYKGIDTVLVLKYYKSGQIKDSAHVTLKDDKEFYFGIQRSYYRSGNPTSIINYKNGIDEFNSVTHFENGNLLSEIKKPGERKFYNKKGELVKQVDINHKAQVYVPKKYRHQKHLITTNFVTRIKFKKAKLQNGKVAVNLRSNALISVCIGPDSVINHCQIEGFSTDSIYVSRFEYNSNIKKDALQYENTFAIGLGQIKTIYFSKNYTRKKYNRARAATVGGIDMIIIPIAMMPFAAASFGTLAPAFGACIIAGIPVYFWGKHLFKKMLPKKYDMNQWKIVFPAKT